MSWPTLSAIYTLANFCFLLILSFKRVLHLCKLLFFKVVIIFNNNNFFPFFKTFIFCQTTTSYVRIIIIPLQKGFHEIALSNCNFALCTAFTNEVKIAVTSFNICCSWVYSLSNVILWCAFASFGDHDAKSKRGYTILAIAYRYSRSLNSAEKYPNFFRNYTMQALSKSALPKFKMNKKLHKCVNRKKNYTMHKPHYSKPP